MFNFYIERNSMKSVSKISMFMYNKLSILGSLLCLSLLPLSGAQANQFYQFSHFQINAPFIITQEPILADLIGTPGKEVILIGEKDQQYKLAMFVFDVKTEQYKLHLNIDLPSNYFSYDVSDDNNDGVQSLYFLSSNHIIEFDPESEQPFKTVIDVSSIYINDNANYLKQANFVTDLNDDGISDVILTDFKSLNIYLNQESGFTEQKLPIYPTVEIFDGSVSYTEKPYYLQDMNFDKRKDIVLTGEGELLVFTQNDQGLFATQEQKLAIRSEISSINWWDNRGADGSNLDQSDFAHRSVHKLTDINNDGLADMIVRFTQSSGVLDKSNDYEVYLGQSGKAMLTFAQKADTAITSDGTLAQMNFIDINSNEQQEVMASSFDISVSQIIGALLTGSVDQKVLIFALDTKQRYQQKFTEEVQLKFSLTSGKSGAPVIELADLDGDGSKELILSESENQLKIFPGQSYGSLLNKKSQKLDVKLPKNGVLLSSDDINLDGKSELIVRYGSEDGDNRQNRLLILHTK